MSEAIPLMIGLTCVGTGGMVLTGSGLGLAVWGWRAHRPSGVQHASTDEVSTHAAQATPEPALRPFTDPEYVVTEPDDESTDVAATEPLSVVDAPAVPVRDFPSGEAASGRTIIAFDDDEDE